MLGWAGGEAEFTDIEIYAAQQKTLHYVPRHALAKVVIGVTDGDRKSGTGNR